MPRPKHHVAIEIDIPTEIAERALNRAIEEDAPERFEAYLLDHLEFDFQYNFEGDDPRDDFSRSSVGQR